VYGVGSDDYKTEASTPNPQTAYANCKVLVERDVGALAADDFSPTFLRNATAYGPSPRMRFDLVLNNLAGLAWTTGQIRMTSDGTPWRPLVHVLDICEAIACTLEAPRDVIHNQILNVGSTQENYRVRDIAQIVSQAFPECQLHVGAPSADNRSYRVSFEKIHELLLGFKCHRDVISGAKELHDVFAKCKLTPQMFEDRQFTRLKQLQHLLDSHHITSELYWSP
jgi:nucleoside-diphosphate-sugar epimerase